MAELGGGIASVVEHKERQVLVSVPVGGIPADFRLRAGDRVVLVNEAAGLVARPLIVSRRARLTAEDLADSAVVKVSGEVHSVQKGSQLGWLSAEGGLAAPGEYDVFVVDSASAEGPKQIIASRPVNPATRKR